MQNTSLKKRISMMMNLRPTTLIVLSFIILIASGTFMLTLPAASRDGEGTSLLVALFTATSAICVTGLIIVDTYQHWTIFGQVVILTLIQAGALGIITFTTFFSALLGKKMRLKSMVLAQESINYFAFNGITQLIKRIVLITLCVEALGALVLSIRFIPQHGLFGIYLGIFHSISAFCNAGFDLMSISGSGQFVSLTGHANDPVVLYTFVFLVMLGGLGFVVWKDLLEYKKTRAMMLHTKLVLAISTFLFIFGAVFFFIFESGNAATIGGFNFYQKIHNSIFMSITTRSSGFNTFHISHMTDISKFLTILLMFIGAAPGSTAGGIKVTTFGVVLFAVLSQLKGSDETIIFKRRVPFTTVSKALAIIGLYTLLLLTFFTIIQAIEGGPMLDILFEVTSAFGIVGLSTGMTSDLHYISKLLLILMMFLGRVGPVTFAIGLTLRSHRNNSDTIYPEGKVIVG